MANTQSFIYVTINTESEIYDDVLSPTQKSKRKKMFSSEKDLLLHWISLKELFKNALYVLVI